MSELFPDENSARLANLVSSYGVGTRSYNRSPEKRELDRQRAEATKEYEANRQEIMLPLVCACRSFRFAHGVSEHKELRSDYDWRTWQERAGIRAMVGQRA